MLWLYSLALGIFKILRDKKTKSKFLHIAFWIKIKFLSLIFPNKSGSTKFLNYSVQFISYKSLSYLFEEIFISHIYHFETKKNNPLIIDAGSNIGIATFYFQFYFPQSNVQCFEADPDTFNYLKKNMSLNNFKNVQIYNLALWSEKTTLLFKKNNNLINHIQFNDIQTNKKAVEAEFITVQANALSHFITEKIDFLKIDIEGAESQVFKELAESRKLNLIDQMTIECHLQNGFVTHLKNILEFISDDVFYIQIGSYQLLNRDFLINQDCMLYVKKKS